MCPEGATLSSRRDRGLAVGRGWCQAAAPWSARSAGRRRSRRVGGQGREAVRVGESTVDNHGRHCPSIPTVAGLGLLGEQGLVAIPMAKKFARRSPSTCINLLMNRQSGGCVRGACSAAAIRNSLPKTGPFRRWKEGGRIEGWRRSRQEQPGEPPSTSCPGCGVC